MLDKQPLSEEHMNIVVLILLSIWAGITKYLILLKQKLQAHTLKALMMHLNIALFAGIMAMSACETWKIALPLEKIAVLSASYMGMYILIALEKIAIKYLKNIDV